MNVLQLTSHVEVGGISTHVATLAERLIARGHRVTVASADGLLRSRLQRAGAVHWNLPLHTSADASPPVAWAWWQLHRRLAATPVDLIHAHTRVAQVIAEGLWRSRKIPYVTTWHGFYRRRLGRRWWPCTGKRTIAISQEVARHLHDVFRVPADRIRLIYHGIDVEHFATPPRIADLQACRSRWPSMQRHVIGCVGRLASGGVKGFDLLLHAVHQLRARFPNTELILVGDGPRRGFLEQEAARLGIQDRVHFVGAMEDVRVPLTLMDVFVFASRWPEAFGLSLIEAMAVGRPVVATRRGAVPEIIEHGRHGWLVPPEDPVALADAISRLLQDPALAAELGRRARQRVREKFHVDRMVDEVEAVYREVLDR